MSLEISIPDADFSSQIVTLGSYQYTIELKFKERVNKWFLTLRDSDGVTLLSERKLLNEMAVTGLFALPDFEGALFVERNFGTDENPSRDNFGHGKEFRLIYFTAQETAIITGAEVE